MYHRDLDAWKLSMNLVADIYNLVKHFPKKEEFVLTNQMCRAAISVPSNIAEGCARSGDKDTLRFFDISLGSLAELETQILIAEMLGYAKAERLLQDIDKIQALVYGLKKYLKTKS